MNFESVSEVLNEDERSQGQTSLNEGGGEPQCVWLLAKLAEEELRTAATEASSSSTKEYQREYVMYVEILKANTAKKGIDNPQVQKVFHSPIWSKSKIVALDDNFGPSTALSTHRTPAGTDPESDQPFDMEKYLFDLNFHYYENKDWFRCMVNSFWGPQIASVFQVCHKNRPFIQMAFKVGWDYHHERVGYYENVVMFTNIMARLCPIEGLGPVTDIFGFVFITFNSQLVSEIEIVERLGIDRPEGMANPPRQIALRHRIEPPRSHIMTIKD
ncbi:hypothetical protein F5Y11DRAFT_361420 [Daldinia sp. FL1419]|nr:hypothetical protein F5Y11DRAFT_361420 [Daldinia sp. FL1419]